MKLAEKAIFELLQGLADGRIYAMRAPANADIPFIVFQRTDSERWRDLNGPSGMAQAYIQVDVYGGSYFAAKNLAASVETLLDGYSGNVQSDDDTITISGISLQNDADLLDQTDDPLLFRNTASYLVTYQQ